MNELLNYYKDQLEKVSGKKAPEFSRQIQIKDKGKQTHWISLNDDSATEIVNYLQEHYNIRKS